MRSLAAALVSMGLTLAGMAQQPAANTADVEKDFSKRLGDYLTVRKNALDGLQKLKPTPKPETIQRHERELAQRIRALRPDAKQGDIFTPEIAADFRRLLAVTMQGPEAVRIRKSLRRAEPVHTLTLKVNATYPHGIPLQSTPPTLLLNLPKLPSEIEYRVVGHALILRDQGANLIIDFLPDAIPAEAHAS